ncbi:MFS transporter [Nocardia yunnanensis]|uniref:MFS transporter n=1 Tax=Nocardia yunnanensis TaxID=2382165 RepID=A0A386ZNX4_9NOCA|nr:MFS transporter [Nocardia yunnanensis]AYF79492.1 MFS transporter [Nocardia yunnanensis]
MSAPDSPHSSCIPESFTEPFASAAAPSTTLNRVGPAFVAIYVLAIFGMWTAALTPTTITLALRVSQLTSSDASVTYSIVAAVGALISLPAQPFFGRLADITRSRFGRRRPWLVASAVGVLVGTGVMAASNSIPGLLIGWIITSVTGTIALTVLSSMIADSIPLHRAGFVAGLAGAAQGVGLMAGALIVRLTSDMTALVHTGNSRRGSGIDLRGDTA